MGRRKMPGLVKKGKTWHIDKKINGVRICESTGTDRLEEAEKYLTLKLETIRQAKIFGVRPRRVFRQAATKFLVENQHKKSIKSDKEHLVLLDSFIGEMPLEAIHMGSLQHFIETRRKTGVKNRTINFGLQIVRHILNLASSEWMDEFGLTWIVSAPKIKLLPENDARKPYPLDWEEQNILFSYLPKHLRDMALFAVNTGCRDKEICRLKWEWELTVPIVEIQSVFIIPGSLTKNGEDRLIVLNRTARLVLERQRNNGSCFVFTYRQKPITRMMNSAWKRARKNSNLSNVRVHDLKHTFGRRLRSTGVSFEDRQDLLGHKSSRITTHYSTAELLNLWEAANRVCDYYRKPTLTLLRTPSISSHAKIPKSVLITKGS
ncbi:MAG: site-specific integrase [Gammaproteobacteria bacterium]|nr:site-specific integrase [Gammaproteobacteria bacterium]